MHAADVVRTRECGDAPRHGWVLLCNCASATAAVDAIRSKWWHSPIAQCNGVSVTIVTCESYCRRLLLMTHCVPQRTPTYSSRTTLRPRPCMPLSVHISMLLPQCASGLLLLVTSPICRCRRWCCCVGALRSSGHGAQWLCAQLQQQRRSVLLCLLHCCCSQLLVLRLHVLKSRCCCVCCYLLVDRVSP